MRHNSQNHPNGSHGTPPPWERRPGETAAQWKAFREYLKRRDFRVVAERIGCSTKTLQNYSSKQGWADRCTAWDSEQARAEDAAILDERARLAKEHLSLWGQARALATSEIARLLRQAEERGVDGEPGVVCEQTIVKLLDLATKYERLVIGEVTDRTETTGSEWDLSKLNDEELAILRELQRKAAR